MILIRKRNQKKLDSFTTHDLTILEKALVYGGKDPVPFVTNPTDPIPDPEGDPDTVGGGVL